MMYNELIHKVQDYSGFSNEESQEALELMVVALSVRLADKERQAFAQQLPENLQDIALTVRKTDSDSRKNMLKQFMDLQQIDESHAKKQIRAAWQALCDALSGKRLETIRSELPPRTNALLK
jgi:uncharacterized protein (DUF2267 family)